MTIRTAVLAFLMCFSGCVSNQSFDSQILSEVDFEPSVDKFLSDWEANQEFDPEALRRLVVTTLDRGLRVPSTKLNVQAIKSVERHEVESLANRVMELVDHPSDVVAAAAAVAVIKSHPPAPHVAKKLAQSSDPEARRIIAEGLGRKIGIISKEDLLRLADDTDPRVQKTALNALAKTKSKEFRALYLQKLKESDGGVVQAAIKGLSGIPQPEDMAAIKFAYIHSHLGVRLEALRLLNRIGKKSRPVLEYLADPKRKDKRLAIEAANHLNKRYGTKNPRLIESLIKLEDSPLRHMAFRSAYLHLDQDSWNNLMDKELRSEDLTRRWRAASLLGQRGDKKAFDRVTGQILKSSKDDLKVEVYGVLAQRGDKAALQTLSNALLNGHQDKLPQFLSASRQAGQRTPGLVNLLRATSTQTRLDAAEILLHTL